MLYIWIMLKHIEEHSPATNKWFYIRSILPIVKVSWKQCVQLFDELTFTANPLDKWFCF